MLCPGRPPRLIVLTGDPFMPPASRRLSADTWAVLLSLALALLVRFGIIRSVPW
jgi:hypothetical protein